MIHFYTGNGKGKTTAAVGQAVRGAGCGMQVIFAQFMKGNEAGELNILSKLSNIRICRSSKNFGFYESMNEDEKGEIREIHNGILDVLLKAAEEQNCQMIILDEITYPVHWQLLDEGRLRRLLEFGDRMELILTGRKPVDYFVEAADYITNMGCVSHPYDKGIGARRGIEF